MKRRKTSLDNKKRNYAVTSGDRVETQHLRLHLHFSPIGSWRKMRKRAPRGLEKDVELWPAKGLRTSQRVHDKSLKGVARSDAAPPLINAPPNCELRRPWTSGGCTASLSRSLFRVSDQARQWGLIYLPFRETRIRNYLSKCSLQISRVWCLTRLL